MTLLTSILADESLLEIGAEMGFEQAMLAIGAGVSAVLGLSKLLQKMRQVPLDKPVLNGERRGILTALSDLEQIMLAQDRTISGMRQTITSLEERIRPLERVVLRIERELSGRQGKE